MPGFAIQRPDTAFANTKQRRPRQRDESHLAFVRKLPCCACGVFGRTQAAHIRAASARHGKRGTGLQEKPDDRWTLPLCSGCHAEQHASDELAFWREHGIDPFDLAQTLRLSNPDEEAAILAIAAVREQR